MKTTSTKPYFAATKKKKEKRWRITVGKECNEEIKQAHRAGLRSVQAPFKKVYVHFIQQNERIFCSVGLIWNTYWFLRKIQLSQQWLFWFLLFLLFLCFYPMNQINWGMNCKFKFFIKQRNKIKLEKYI